jgi:ribosomal protein S18 acetylase RimI-like enzyme
MFTYRPATPADIPSIVQFQIAMALETEGLELDLDICTKGVASVFESDFQFARYFVAESEDKVIGSLMITYEWSDWRNGVVWWIQSLYVSPDYRRVGVFKGLFNYIQKIVSADPKIKGVRLYVDTRNKSAQQVYEKIGMIGDHYTVFEAMK